MRELFQMLDGRRREQWNHTSLLAALIFNQHAPRYKQKKPADFNPLEHSRRRGHRLTAATIDRLKIFLPDGGADYGSRSRN